MTVLTYSFSFWKWPLLVLEILLSAPLYLVFYYYLYAGSELKTRLLLVYLTSLVVVGVGLAQQNYKHLVFRLFFYNLFSLAVLVDIYLVANNLIQEVYVFPEVVPWYEPNFLALVIYGTLFLLDGLTFLISKSSLKPK